MSPEARPPSAPTTTPPNVPRRNMVFAAGALIVALAGVKVGRSMIETAPVYGWLGMSLVLVVPFALFGLFSLWSSARRVDRLIAGEGLLARWDYTPEEWRLFVEGEYQKTQGGLVLVSVLACGAIGVVAIIKHEDEGALPVLGGLAAFAAVAPSFFGWYERRSQLRAAPVTLVGEASLYMAGVLADWGAGTRRWLERASLEETGYGLLLVVRYGYYRSSRRIPVRTKQTGIHRCLVPGRHRKEGQRVADGLRRAAQEG